MTRMMATRAAEPKADSMPIRIPFPVEPSPKVVMEALDLSHGELSGGPDDDDTDDDKGEGDDDGAPSCITHSTRPFTAAMLGVCRAPR